MPDESDGPSEDEKTVKDTALQIGGLFVDVELAGLTDDVGEETGNAAVDVEDEVVLFGGGDLLYGQGVVQHLEGKLEVGSRVLNQNGHSSVGVLN